MSPELEVAPSKLDIVVRFEKGEREEDAAWRDDVCIGNNRLRCILGVYAWSCSQAISSHRIFSLEKIVEEIVTMFSPDSAFRTRLLEREIIGIQGRYSYFNLQNSDQAKLRVMQALVATLKADIHDSQKETGASRESEKPDSSKYAINEYALQPVQATKDDVVPAVTTQVPSCDNTPAMEDKSRKRKRLSVAISESDSSSIVAPDHVTSSGPVAEVSTFNAFTSKVLKEDDFHKFDVVMSGKILDAVVEDSRHVGNNRFRVLCIMQRDKFSQASQEERRCIAANMYREMQQYVPPGRIVIKDTASGCWKEADPETAITIAENTLKAACKAMGDRIPITPVSRDAKTDIASLRSAAIASLRERMEKKRLMRELESRGNATK